MSRSIVRSKINAKYNFAGTGGGGGSAISVYDETTLLTANVTSFTFKGLGIDATAAGSAVTVTVDNHEVIEVKNATGATIPKGAVCYINPSGTSGTHPEILLSSAATESTSSKTIGVVHSPIAPGAIGLLIINGEIVGTGSDPLDTSMYNAGAMLWLSNTPGQWTTTIPPFPSHSVFIGHVTRSQNVNGRVVIKIQNGYEVQELHDAVIGTKLHGQFLMVDTVTYAPNVAWVNQRLVTLVTVSQLTTLRNNNGLIHGMTYWINNAPIVFLPGIGTANFFLKAIATDALESCGTLEILMSGPPNSYRAVQCWYDLDTNTHPKFIDPYNKNTIEGWVNIQSFVYLSTFLGGITSNSLKNNSIINGGNLNLPSTITGLTIFDGNYIDGGILHLDNVVIDIIENNKLIDSALFLVNSAIARINGNHFKNSSFNDPAGNLDVLAELRYNYLENSIVTVDKDKPGLIEFQRNNISQSTITLDNTLDLFYINDNCIDNSVISVLNGSSFNSIIKNNIFKSTLQFSAATLQAFENNSLDNSTLDIIGSLTGAANILNNTIHKSFIQNVDCELNYCNTFGMGYGSSAYLNTTTSYNNCNYRLYEDSTFYVSYDIDNSDIPTINTFVVPTGHETWVGKFIFYSSLGGGPYSLKTIANPVANHRYYIYMDGGFSRLDMDISTGFFVMPQSAAGLIQLQNQYDYMYVDGRPSPIGTQTGGENVVISYDYY